MSQVAGVVGTMSETEAKIDAGVGVDESELGPDVEKGLSEISQLTDEGVQTLEQPSSDQPDAGDASIFESKIEKNRRLLSDVMQRLSALNEPVTYTWTKISCFVPIRHHKGRGSCRKSANVQVQPRTSEVAIKKQILHEVTGVAKSGQLFAIMGASGSGKTTLLNILNMRSHLERSGELRLNGVPVTHDMVQEVGAYVQQDDLFLPHLTVEEHLTFAAMLRVPSFVTYRERKLLIEKIMDDVGLLKVRKTQIGSARKFRGISGGEMKRLNFATEVLTNPSILFCDEPTSGLDGFTTASIVSIMRKLADEGKTIISTIHQPSSNVLAMFDCVYLLAEGRVAFCGNVNEALKFMKTQGFECPATYNPADFLVHTLAIHPDHRVECLEKVREICDAYEQSDQARIVSEEASANKRPSVNILKLKSQKRPKYWANWFQQLFWLMWRQQFVIRREPLALSTQIIQAVGVAVFVGSVFLKPEFDDKNVRNIVSLGFVVVAQAVLFPQYAVITTFSDEMPVFMRESEQRVYRTECYYLAKFFSETPLYSILPTITAIIVYPWTQVAKLGSRALFLITTTMGFAGNIGRSLGYLVSIVGGDAPTALQLGPIFVVPFFLFNGLMVSSDTLLEGLHWLEAISWIYLCTESTTIAIWQDIKNVTYSPEFPTHYVNGEGVLRAYGFNPDNISKNFSVLLFEIIVVNILSFLILYVRAIYHRRR